MTDLDSNAETPFISHLIELRDRLLRCVLAVVLILLPLLYFSNDIYTIVATPLIKNMPAGSSMIAIEVASPFLTPFKLSMVCAIFLAMPFILYQFWAFMAPGLYQHERRMVVPLIISSTFLFYAGIVFAYFVVFPLIFAFLTGVAPQGVAVMTDISKYLDFVLKLVFAFGVAFEVPIATIILVWTGVTTPEKLSGKRPYIIVGAFVIGMLLTPPDIFSQTMLAIPMWILFEAGVFFSRRFVRNKEETEENTIHSEAPESPEVATNASGVAASNIPAAHAAASEPENEEEWADEEPHQDLSDEEMEAELDRIEDEEGEQDENEPESTPEDKKKDDKPDKDT
jgi:sec-independent protein translocase protein TatC